MIMLARRGSHVLVPRNCHRSIVNALVLTGLEPIWYEPVWEEAWGVWGPVTGNIIASALKASRQENLAGVVVVSPSYVGAISELKKIASVCHENGLPLLVDEADGAHCLLPETAELSALNCGADLVVHSLHKTIGALTQTGVAHISKGGAASFSFTPEELRTTLNLVQSSSPSYIFLSSIDERISALESGECAAELRELERLGQILRRHVKQLKHISVYEPIFGALNSGVMLGCPNIDALDELLMQQGIYSEIIVRPGLLLLLGIGSNENDVNFLLQALKEFDKSLTPNPGNAAGSPPSNRPEPIEQVLSPRQAFYMPSRVVSVAEAIGEIAVECVAPCPPGWPVTIPGQKIKASQLRGLNLPSVRVVVQPS
jgi:arginine/lysine/ornithine decarboxylase